MLNKDKTPAYFLLWFFVIAFVLYFPVIKAPFIFDDIRIVKDNQIFLSLDVVKIFQIYTTRAITFITYLFNYMIGGYDPKGYHILNILIHALNSIGVFFLSRQVFRITTISEGFSNKQEPLWPIFAGLLFLIHPAQTGTVSYVGERATLIMAFFYVFALNAYLKFRITKSIRMAFFFAFAIAVGCFTKEIFFSIFLVLFIAEWVLFKSDLLKVAAFFIAALLLLWLFVYFFEYRLINDLLMFFNNPGSREHFSPNVYVLTQFRVFLSYLRIMAIPAGLNFFYSYNPVRSFGDVNFMIGAIGVLVFALSAVMLRRKNAVVSFGMFLILAGLFFEVSLYPFYFWLKNFPRGFIEIERIYMPMIGFSLLAVGFLKAMTNDNNRKVMREAMVFICLILAIITFSRSKIWEDPIKFWTDVIEKSPREAMPYNNRAFWYGQKKDLARALSDLNKALELNKDYVDAYYNRGMVFLDKELYDNAINDFTQVLRLKNSSQTMLVKAYEQVSKCYTLKKDMRTAVLFLEKAVKLDSTNGSLYNALSVNYFLLKDKDKAKIYLEKAIQHGFKPNDDYLGSIGE